MPNNKAVRFVFLLLTTTTLILISLYTYIQLNTPIVPDCRATLKIDISDDRSSLNGYYLLSIIPSEDNDNQYSFIMSGEINFNHKKFIISRKMLIEYKQQGGHFFSRIKNIYIDPSDQAGDDIYIRGLPQLNQIYFTRVKRLNDKNYIFEENYSPMFICTI
ncbi:FidL-like protein [Providencia sp. PROV197]|uniref:FidL-like protein n=1 Tax=Providencia sp. PROV197 TaxID=2949898 RepID=UPI00234AE005|nr:FidL-like protein [Providencia sp. PROV197]